MVWLGDVHGMAAYGHLNEGLASGDSASLLIAENVVVSFCLALNQSMFCLKLIGLKKIWFC